MLGAIWLVRPPDEAAVPEDRLVESLFLNKDGDER